MAHLAINSIAITKDNIDKYSNYSMSIDIEKDMTIKNQWTQKTGEVMKGYYLVLYHKYAICSVDINKRMSEILDIAESLESSLDGFHNWYKHPLEQISKFISENAMEPNSDPIITRLYYTKEHIE